MPDEKWTEAMDWWRSAPESDLIRMVANQKLSQLYAGTGQGISSSDTNHEVFHMYRDWGYFKDYCAKENKEPSISEFLVDYLTT